MRALLLCLACAWLPASGAASVSATWASPTSAVVSWSGAGGPGVCLHLERPGYPSLILAETCGQAAGAVALGRGGDYLRQPVEGLRVTLRGFQNEELASAALGEPPTYDVILPLVVGA